MSEPVCEPKGFDLKDLFTLMTGHAIWWAYVSFTFRVVDFGRPPEVTAILLLPILIGGVASLLGLVASCFALVTKEGFTRPEFFFYVAVAAALPGCLVAMVIRCLLTGEKL